MNPELVKRSLKEEILKPRYRDAIGSIVHSVLVEQGLAAQLCNGLHAQEEATAHALRASRQQTSSAGPSSERAQDSPLPPHASEELHVVHVLNDKWMAQLHNTLLAHCDETGQALMKVTAEPSSAPGTRAARPGRGVKWLYSTDDLLQLLESAEHPNQASHRTGAKSWCLTPLALWTPRLPQLRQMFAELAPSERQNGLDDELRG